MKSRLMEILACPRCGHSLKLEVFMMRQGKVHEGLLSCHCREWFPVIGGVPRMLLDPFRGDYSQFEAKYLKRNTKLRPKPVGPGGANALSRRKTGRSFGLEWTKYDRYGWAGRGSSKKIDIINYCSAHNEHLWSHTTSTFWRKTLLAREEVKGRLVLDVGVGNGRYAQVCRDSGARVVGVDLSRAVDVAYRNTGGEVDIVQCDIFSLPFKEASFDIVYSIGVLHHTPSTHRAFDSIQKFARKGGVVSVHLYHKGNAVYEFCDHTTRLITTRLPLGALWYLCYVPTAIGYCTSFSRIMYALLNSLIVMRSGHHFNFDWYSAPVAFHHTEEEVVRWCTSCGFKEVQGDDPCRNPDSYYAKIYPKFARNADGSVKKWAARIVPRWAFTVRGKK